MYKIVYSFIIAAITLVSILSGCVDRKDRTPPQATIKETGDSMNDLTYERVIELNKKSDLLGITLLEVAPSDLVMPGPNTLGTGRDYYNCFLFDGENRITQIGLLSETANVYGIAVGNSLSQVKETLTSEDFTQLGDEETKSLINKNENAIAFQMAYITLIFFTDEKESNLNDATITKILINVDNPLEEKPTF